MGDWTLIELIDWLIEHSKIANPDSSNLLRFIPVDEALVSIRIIALLKVKTLECFDTI